MKMKTVQNLLNATKDVKKGNHRVKVFPITMNKQFFYYNTMICWVNDNDKTFAIDDSYGTVSTKRACNSYRRELLSMGYTEVTL